MAVAKKRSETKDSKRSADENMHFLGKTIDPDKRFKMISEAAYYKAENRGFSGEDNISDWLEAESEIDNQLNI